MQTVKTITLSETEVKKSLFLAFLVPIERYETERSRLRKEHPKANHIAEATRKLDTMGRVEESFSDDGEPRGCAGMPILNVMRGHHLIDAALFVVRYFGGTKLGTGGMARAYGDAAKAVIQTAPLISHITRSPYAFETSFAIMRRYEHFFKNHDIVSSEREFTESGVRWRLYLSEAERNLLEAFQKELGDQKNRPNE